MYKEDVKFTQWWYWAALIVGNLGIIILMALGTYNQLSGIEPFGDNNMSNEQLLLLDCGVLLVIIFMFWIFTTCHLEYTVSKGGVSYRFKPFKWNWKKISQDKIESAEVIELPIFFRMGIGFRPIPFYGLVMHIKGKYGLKVVHSNGKHLTMSCSNPEALQKVLNQLMHQNG